jgi:exopolysaccharide biosynthesis polyprenyl glycosylphosphotransferase
LPPQLVHILLNKLRILPRAIYLMPDEDVAGLLRLEVQAVGNDLVVEVQRAPLSPAETIIKRVVDLAIASVCLVIMAPVLLVIGLIIKLDSPGPMLFKQERLGHRSRPFRILKFRTMRVMEDGESVVQASKNDGRITRVGRILRRTSIDELPQLVNVLKGEMSIIGPRPHAVAHDRLFSKLVDNYELRQHVKPGITGWAQVNGYRGETAQVELMRSRIEMDIWYATNCSLLLDAQILLRTSYELFRQRNAY